LELGLTQEALSEKTGISQANLSRIERGEIETRTGYLIEIKKALNVSTDCLLGFE